MKKLNIFKVTNKKTSSQAEFSSDNSISSDAKGTTSGDGTILRIVSKKEVVSKCLGSKKLTFN